MAGEIIECMACSDNVVRAGLTPKFKDVDNLVSLLTYTMGGPNIDAGAVVDDDPRIIRYTPPVPEFEVLIITVRPGEDLTLPDFNVPAVLIVIEVCCLPESTPHRSSPNPQPSTPKPDAEGLSVCWT